MATSQNQPNYAGDAIIWETNQQYTRAELTVGASQTLVPGSVTYASGGNQIIIASGQESNANAICLQKVTTAGGQTAKAVFLVRGPALVRRDRLGFGTATAATVITALQALGMQVRNSVEYSA
jgi:hypothetical protein